MGLNLFIQSEHTFTDLGNIFQIVFFFISKDENVNYLDLFIFTSFYGYAHYISCTEIHMEVL